MSKQENKKEEIFRGRDEFDDLAKQYPARLVVYPRESFESQLSDFLRKHFKK